MFQDYPKTPACRNVNRWQNLTAKAFLIAQLAPRRATSFSDTFHAFNFDKYARRYQGGYCFRFNRRFSMAGMTEQIANAVCCCIALTERNLRVAEACG